MDIELDFVAMNHEDFFQASIKALEDGISRDDADLSKEQTCFLIALTNATLALYSLLLKKEMIAEEQAIENFKKMQKVV